MWQTYGILGPPSVAQLMSESFRPRPNLPPNTFIGQARFHCRLLLDFQLLTVYRHMKIFLPSLEGTVLDLGAGPGPYRHLLNATLTRYCPVDVYDAEKFGYGDAPVIYFDGDHLPFQVESVQHIICTEVIEHIEDPHRLIDEMYRVLKPGGRAVITVPWSARFHYIPFDYHRFTPTRLASLVSQFSEHRIEPRGTDLTVIASKAVVAYARMATSSSGVGRIAALLGSLILAPVVTLCVLLGHASLLLRLGSVDDPLGYTIWLRK